VSGPGRPDWGDPGCFVTAFPLGGTAPGRMTHFAS
jgi:hypothetical protein